MVFDTDFKAIIDRAWSLHKRLNFEIENSLNLCRFCSENGHLYCEIAYQKTPFLTSESLVAIRDSLKDVQSNLSFLQKLQSNQARERLEALNRLEESRSVLIELVKNFKGAKTPDVLRDLNACFGDQNDVVARNSRDKLQRNGNVKEEPKWSLSSLAKKLWRNWKWRRAFGIAVKFLIISLSISYSRRKLESTESEMRESVLTISRNPLNVFQARG